MTKILITIIFFSIPVFSYSQDDTIRARIAILHKAGEIYNPLKTKDRLKAGEMIRVFILPEKDCFVYAVHSGSKESFLLCKAFLKKDRDTLFLPTSEDYYIFDEGGVKEKISIFCSINKVDEIENLFEKSEIISSVSWNKTEAKLIASAKTDLNESSDKPFSLAGNVSAVNEDFIEGMQLFVGDRMLIRKYEIEVKK